MIKTLKSMVLAGAILLGAAPSYAQTAGNPLGVDLDPFHIFTPAPKPMQKMRRHRMVRHRMMKKPMTMKKKHMAKKHMEMKKMKKK